MTADGPIGRELGLLLRDRAVWVWVILAALLAALAVLGGLREVALQEATIARLVESDREDRESALSRQSDWGGAAYYALHFTYNPPSEFAFAALGRRDYEPWKHRVRMLALEGQIHERDAGNPALARVGRFDFAFLAAFVIPLILIALLHDLQANERSSGRHALLVATSGRSSSPWVMRAVLRCFLLYAATALPLLLACLLSDVAPLTVFLVLGLLLAYIGFWGWLCFRIAALERPSSVLLALLMGIWLLTSVIIPATASLTINALVSLPSGADILMTQREAVNDAWDLPKEATMDAFVERHPEWSDFAGIGSAFEWKWYYAFQQVGDQKTEALSAALREGRLKRDRLAALSAWLAPPALLERALQRLAKTDLRAQLAYEDRIRAFHAQLRAFYYARLFPGLSYDADDLQALPDYDPRSAP